MFSKTDTPFIVILDSSDDESFSPPPSAVLQPAQLPSATQHPKDNQAQHHVPESDTPPRVGQHGTAVGKNDGNRGRTAPAAPPLGPNQAHHLSGAQPRREATDADHHPPRVDVRPHALVVKDASGDSGDEAPTSWRGKLPVPGGSAVLSARGGGESTANPAPSTADGFEISAPSTAPPKPKRATGRGRGESAASSGPPKKPGGRNYIPKRLRTEGNGNDTGMPATGNSVPPSQVPSNIRQASVVPTAQGGTAVASTAGYPDSQAGNGSKGGSSL